MQRNSKSQRSSRKQGTYKEETLLRARALKHCANWDNGNCSGCIIKTHCGTVYQLIDSKMYGKSCNPIGCKYYESLVSPVLKTMP